MAPTISADFGYTELSNKEKHKLRKPVVEKMRRDRINNSIEQLKAMLEKEFHKQDPNTKLEKADILEMTVLFLKQQLQSQSPSLQQAHSDGYTQCWRGDLNLLSVKSEMDSTVLPFSYCHSVQNTATDFSPVSPVMSPEHSQTLVKQVTVAQKSVWRPW
ncbi:hypothetical protein ACEWY4_013565 [Coilia grayii]|uniref:Transcription factor HES-5 n=1 Tax=Coilia grayii TaxID=363190 RepID=A0ABD1JWP8_9TELE